MATHSPAQHREHFARIEEGMAVYGHDGKRVGKVVDRYPGGETLAELGALPASSPLGAVPRAYQSRLAWEGFVAVAAGLLRGSATPPRARWPGWRAAGCSSASRGMNCSARDRTLTPVPATGEAPPAA